MHIVLLTHYFPPEVNAPANRSFDHAREWVAAGNNVTVITGVPNHPTGKPYPGYSNRWTQRETSHGIEIIRIWTWLAANRGLLGRMIGFASYFFSVALHLRSLPKGTVVVSTSPQFFCGLAGWLLRSRHNRWVLEIRDLWPESIVAVGAMRRSPVIRVLERLETWAYRSADMVVAVTHGFVPHIATRRGRSDVVVVRNGVMADALLCSEQEAGAFRAAHGLGDRFVATYLGTHGMAHALDRVLDAAERLRDRPDIAILLVGDGAARDALLRRKQASSLDNVIMLGQVPRTDIAAIWGASDAALVTLRKSATFKTVLPSKMFEAMATATPIVLGVEGEARDLLDEAGAGLAIEPESAEDLARALMTLADDRLGAAALGTSGRRWFEQHADRSVLAHKMLDAMSALVTAGTR